MKRDAGGRCRSSGSLFCAGLCWPSPFLSHPNGDTQGLASSGRGFGCPGVGGDGWGLLGFLASETGLLPCISPGASCFPGAAGHEGCQGLPPPSCTCRRGKRSPPDVPRLEGELITSLPPLQMQTECPAFLPFPPPAQNLGWESGYSAMS